MFPWSAWHSRTGQKEVQMREHKDRHSNVNTIVAVLGIKTRKGWYFQSPEGENQKSKSGSLADRKKDSLERLP